MGERAGLDAEAAYEPTGRADVDAILDRLGHLSEAPLREHVDIFDDIHRRLHETLLAAGEDDAGGDT